MWKHEREDNTEGNDNRHRFSACAVNAGAETRAVVCITD